jgi:hypothetical protein
VEALTRDHSSHPVMFTAVLVLSGILLALAAVMAWGVIDG